MRKGWEYKKLGEVATYINGYAFKPDQWKESGTPIVRIQNLNNENAPYNYYDGEVPDKVKIQNGDLLISWSASLGAYIWHGGNAFLNQHIFKVAFDKTDIDKFFLKYAVTSKLAAMAEQVHGATMKHIVKKDFDNTQIPYPPLSTQLAIVSELDKINELIRLKKEQLKDFDNLAQSLFYEVFGDPVENEKGWEMKKLGEVCTDIKYGTSKPASENGRYTYLRMCNLTTDGFLDLSNTKQIDIPDDEIEKCIVRYGDILFNRTNSIELVGKTCLFDKKEPMVIAGYIIRVRLNDTLLPVVLARMFNLASIKKLLRSMAKGAVNQANINSKELASIRIPLPPLPLQRLFAQRIEQIEREKSEVQKSIQDLETLLASRMQYWFE